MHVPQIGRRAIAQGLGNHRPKAFGRKGKVLQASQRQPCKAHLPTILLLPCPQRRKISTPTMKDRFDLMEMPMDAMHGVILAHILAQINQPLRDNGEPKLFQDLAPNGITQVLPMILPAPR